MADTATAPGAELCDHEGDLSEIGYIVELIEMATERAGDISSRWRETISFLAILAAERIGRVVTALDQGGAP